MPIYINPNILNTWANTKCPSFFSFVAGKCTWSNVSLKWIFKIVFYSSGNFRETRITFFFFQLITERLEQHLSTGGKFSCGWNIFSCCKAGVQDTAGIWWWSQCEGQPPSTQSNLAQNSSYWIWESMASRHESCTSLLRCYEHCNHKAVCFVFIVIC